MHKYEIETNSIQKVLLEYKCGLWRVEISTRCKCIEYTPSNEDKAREWFEFVISDIKKGKDATEIYSPDWQDVEPE